MPLISRIINRAISLHPQISSEIDEYIISVDCGIANIYIYRRDGHTIAFDTGYNARSTTRALLALAIDPAEVGHVFLSHTDFDHAGGLPAFSRARIYYAQAEVRIFARQSRYFRRAQTNQTCQALRDREIVEIGSTRIMALHTPGHTPGSIAYLVDGIYLFSGDTIALRGGKAGINHLFSLDFKTLRLSANNLSKLEGVKTVLTPHWGYANFPEAFSQWGRE
ncbi:MAG: MBL fold metallo-hydrolase [Clostridiales bacterium]|nr:MBL fold metallo-hydrolase [Clostridiales bacterium]MDR2713833.1 MBL fold metallo-hydrolase [Clostridiales bacterium]